MLSCGLTGLGAGGGNCCIGHYRVALRRNGLLCQQHFITYAAMLSCGLTGLGAGRRNCCIYHLGVTLGSDGIRRLHDLTTGKACLFLCMPIFRTGSSLIFLCQSNVIMGRFLRDFRLLFEHYSAEPTTLSICQTGLCTGSWLSPDWFGSVTFSGGIRIIYLLFTVELLSAQQNFDRIYIFSILCAGCSCRLLDRNAICCSGDRVITVLALRRNLYRSKAAIRRNVPLPYGFCFLLHSMTNSRDGLLCLLYPTAF